MKHIFSLKSAALFCGATSVILIVEDNIFKEVLCTILAGANFIVFGIMLAQNPSIRELNEKQGWRH